jgi:4-amino-4-deoxy-L-arabinose transferase-like glycosyltransferase
MKIMIKRLPLLPTAAFILTLFSCFFGLGSYGLLDNNEGLYASIARDMAAGGNLIIPHLNGLPYIEKPPMLYWLTALSFHLFGTSEWAARLPEALALLGTIAACSVFIGRKVGANAGAATALVISSSLVTLVIGREILCDMLFTCFVTCALLAAYNWYASQKRLWLLAAYVAGALAVLTKGPTALALIGGVALSFLVVERIKFTVWRRAIDPFGIALFLLIAAPWFILASREEPDFAWFYFINEHVLRFLNLRQPHDYYNGPWWYYLPRILGYLFPWTLFLPLLARSPRTTLERFLYCWFGWMLFFFSLSGAKANYYMIVGIPPLAMLLGCACAARLPKSAIAILASTIVIMVPMAICLFQDVEPLFSQKIVADYLNTHDAAMETGMYRDFEEFSAIPFYLNRRIPVVDSQSGDLLYGQQRYVSQGGFATLAQWLEHMGNGGNRLVVRNIYLPSFRKALAKTPQYHIDAMESFPLTSVVVLKRD